MQTRTRGSTQFYGDVVFHGGLSDGIFNTLMYQRLNDSSNQRRSVKIQRPQFLHEMPARFMRGANVSFINTFLYELSKNNHVFLNPGYEKRDI